MECSDCWKNICLSFDAVMCPTIAAVRKGKSEMNLKFSIGPSQPISKIATSHVCIAGLKKLGDESGGKLNAFLIENMKSTMSRVSSD